MNKTIILNLVLTSLVAFQLSCNDPGSSTPSTTDSSGTNLDTNKAKPVDGDYGQSLPVFQRKVYHQGKLL